jgi:hypothetical protein
MNRKLAIIIVVSLIVNGCEIVTSLSTDQKFVEKTDILSFSSIQLSENFSFLKEGGDTNRGLRSFIISNLI